MVLETECCREYVDLNERMKQKDGENYILSSLQFIPFIKYLIKKRMRWTIEHT
jgi:hypothetical protein